MIENRSGGADAPRVARGMRHPHALALLLLALSTSLFASCAVNQPRRSTDVTPSSATPALSQLDTLLAQIQDSSSSKRQDAATQLGLLHDRAAVPALGDALDDADPSVQGVAAEALAALGDPRAVEPLLAFIAGDREPDAFMTAVRALGTLGDARAVAQLLELASGNVPNILFKSTVTQAADEALDAIGPAAVPALAEAVGSSNAEIALTAIAALERLGWAAAVPTLAQAAGSSNAEIALAAVAAIERLGPAAVAALEPLGLAAVPALAKAVGSPDSEIALAAVAALGRLGQAAVPALARAVGSPDSETALAAVAALGRLGAPALDALLAALGDKRSAVRVAAADALGGFGKPAVKPLIAVLKHKDLALRVAAAASLGQIGDRVATSALIAALADAKVADEHGGDHGLFGQASAALAQIHRGDTTALVTYLKAQKTVVVYLALIWIGQADTRSALMTALRKFGDVAMAEEYLNCGEATLEKAARDWAKVHGYEVGPGLPSPPCIGPKCSEPAWGGG